ncbi:MAG: hypothetical protein HKL85_02375 [Acidimicrobiaceae bacterium]|nr:hypothetical protein [Acidimicrobiaceae bacterium]
MTESAKRSSVSRRVHFVFLWFVLAVVVDLGFWRRHTWADRVPLSVIVALAALGISRTRDAGHLERSRTEDPLPSLAGCTAALVLIRGAGLAPIVAATLTGRRRRSVRAVDEGCARLPRGSDLRWGFRRNHLATGFSQHLVGTRRRTPRRHVVVGEP